MTEENENCTEVQQRENRLKAIELNIESLKQYITLSTVAIAGMFVYYSASGKASTPFLFIAIGLFALCAIVSVYNINLFINKVNKNEIDVRAVDARKANFFAIILFVLAIVSTTIFFSSTGDNTKNIQTEDSKIILRNQNIEIGKDVKTKVTIKTDSIGNQFEIHINK